MSDFKEHDVVQIVDETHPWFGCFLVVTEPKPWGFQGYASWPLSNAKHDIATAYNRLKSEQVALIGRAEVIIGRSGEEVEDNG